MKKVILEILRLCWKVIRTYFWTFLKPFIYKAVVLFVLFVSAVAVLGVLLARGC